MSDSVGMNLIRTFFIFSLLQLSTVFAAKAPIDWDLGDEPAVALGSFEPDLKFREIKQAFEKGLAEYLKCPGGISVLFWPVEAKQLEAGVFPRLEIRFRDGALQGIETLNVNRGRVSVYDLKYDLARLQKENRLVIESIGDLKFRMRLSENDINHFLVNSEDRLRMTQPAIELKDGKMFFQARVRTLFFNSRVKTEGNFVVNREDQTVDFRAFNASLNSLPVPGFVLGNLLSRVNPVLKLKKFPLVELMNLELDDVEIQNGWIELSGS